MHRGKTKTPNQYRSIWISDVHLGFKGCRAEFLLDFLHSTESEFLYLVGDIIDVWNLKKGVFWPQTHNDVIRAILDKANNGTKVVYIPGNHDEVLRDFPNTVFGNVIVKTEDIHTTVNGTCLLIQHGDDFDGAVKCSKLLMKIGDFLYDWLLVSNHFVNHLRRKCGFSYWSLASFLKSKFNNAVRYIERFEEAVAHEAYRRGADGLICGHIHKAALKRINGVLYCNTGDWVESCSGLVEHHNGELELLYWTDHMLAQSDVISIQRKPVMRKNRSKAA